MIQAAPSTSYEATQSATGTFSAFAYVPVVAATLKASAAPSTAVELVGAVPI